jgi:hypothetical protein
MRKRIVQTLPVAVILIWTSEAITQNPPTDAKTASQGTIQREASRPAAGVSGETKASTVSSGKMQIKTSTYHVKLSEANQKAAVGDYAEAVSMFQEAKDLAHESSDSRAEAESSLNLARTIERSRGKASLDTATFHRADAAYLDTIRLGNTNQRAAALNGRAMLLLRQGDAAGALQQLNAINLQQVDSAHRAVYRYNSGIANEKSGHLAEAYDSYVAAIADKPEYQSSAEAAFRLLRSGPQPHIPEAAKFVDALLNAGQTSSAGYYAKQLLQQWSGQSDSQQLLAALLRYYAVSSLALDALQEQEWPYLNRLSMNAPHLQKAVAEIRVACFEKFRPVFEHYQALELFHEWGNLEWQQKSMAGMLKKAGGLLRGNGDSQGALARYSAAWALSSDSEAALYAASILHDRRSLIDSNGQLFEQLLRGIIAVKGMQYSQRDWPNILRMHMLLGTIFEQEKTWGSEHELRSAIFQWRHAIDAEDQIRRSDPNYPLSPMLYMKLANAYREKGDPQALGLYLSAAEAFVQASNAKQARSALQAAENLNGSNASVPERMIKIDRAIKDLESRPHS